MREKIIEAIEENKLIVIVRGVARENLIPLAEALYAGGVRLMEITYDATGKTTDEETAENIRMLCEHFDGRMFIGAGTVLTPRQAELTKAAGGGFIISPNADESVIRKTRELSMVSMPGALTPSEIQNAHIFGADFVKLFPITNMGVSYVKAITAPLSHIKILAVGGISLDNMDDYKNAGVCGFGLGSNIIDKKALADGDYEKITSLAKKYSEAAK